LGEFYKDNETNEDRFFGLESCLEVRFVGCMKERRGGKAAFLGGVFSAHVVKSWEGEFSRML